MLTHIVRHIFRMARPIRTSNLVYRWRTMTRISHRRHDLQGQRSRSQGHVISLSRLGPMLYLCHYSPAGHTVSAEPGGHTSCLILIVRWVRARYAFFMLLLKFKRANTMTARNVRLSNVLFFVSILTTVVLRVYSVWSVAVQTRDVWLSGRLVRPSTRLQLLRPSLPHHLPTSATRCRLPRQRDVAVWLPAMPVHGQYVLLHN